MENHRKYLYPSFYILGKPLFFSVFPVKNRKDKSVGGGRGNLKHNTPVFSGDVCVRKQNDWKRCWSSYVAAVLLQIRMWKLYALPILWTWKGGLVPVRAGLCGFCYVLSERRKELSLVLAWSSSEVPSLFQKFSQSTALAEAELRWVSLRKEMRFLLCFNLFTSFSVLVM